MHYSKSTEDTAFRLNHISAIFHIYTPESIRKPKFSYVFRGPRNGNWAKIG